MAAGQAAACGADVLILEKMKRPGRKLRITGKGRCNLTNNAPLEDFLNHCYGGRDFLRQPFSHFFSGDLLHFFNDLGVRIELERGGRYFPEGNRAEDIVDALVDWVKALNVNLYTDEPVKWVSLENGTVTGVETGRKKYKADAVILTTGGISYPLTGSTGDGYILAEKMGHTIVQPRLSLVPLVTKGETAQQLQGLALKNVTAKLLVDNTVIEEKLGEMLFTHFGLSGPIILTLSRNAVNTLNEKKEVAISIDLKPGLDENKLEARLIRDFEQYGSRKFKTMLKGLLPSTLIPVCCTLTKIDGDKIVAQIRSDERARLNHWLKDFRFDVYGYRGVNESIITQGGVSTDEIDPNTMESKLIKNLYFAGEIIDIDADTGGYNLQIAFSTGYTAGISAAVL